MARLASIHSPPPSAIILNECVVRTSSPRPSSQYIMWKPRCSKDFWSPSLHMLCKLSHGPGLVEKRHCSSLYLSCLSRSHTHEVGMCVPKRSTVLVIASATANSDQSPPSHEEDGEGAIGCCEDEVKVLPKKPSPEIDPGDVVQAQLQALHDHDFTTVFEFASPKNKAHTGPLSRFTDMIQGRAYNVMLGHKSAEVLSTLSVGPERFQQRVLITGSNGKQAIFSWSLSRQETDPFQDCWMTDSVHRDE